MYYTSTIRPWRRRQQPREHGFSPTCETNIEHCPADKCLIVSYPAVIVCCYPLDGSAATSHVSQKRCLIACPIITRTSPEGLRARRSRFLSLPVIYPPRGVDSRQAHRPGRVNSSARGTCRNGPFAGPPATPRHPRRGNKSGRSGGVKSRPRHTQVTPNRNYGTSTSTDPAAVITSQG